MIRQAVVELVREFNPTGHVVILEGVANGNTKDNMTTLGYTPDQIIGVNDFVHLEARSGGWREYDSPRLTSVTLPEGVGLYPDNLKVNRSPEFYLNRIYYEADVLISDATYRAAGEGVRSERVGPMMAKGLAEPVVVHRLIG